MATECINEEGDGPCRGFGYSILVSDPLDMVYFFAHANWA